MHEDTPQVARKGNLTDTQHEAPVVTELILDSVPVGCLPMSLIAHERTAECSALCASLNLAEKGERPARAENGESRELAMSTTQTGVATQEDSMLRGRERVMSQDAGDAREASSEPSELVNVLRNRR
jgi:hypothetical protein